MSFQQRPSGPNNVLEYQASGLPYATQRTTVSGSVAKIEFPYVTKFFQVTNLGSTAINVGFTSNGVQGTNRITLASSGSFQGDIRVTDLFVFGGGSAIPFQVVAGLTQIPRSNFYVLTGALNNFSGSQEDYGFRGLGYGDLGGLG
jgi:hypothetical protein